MSDGPEEIARAWQRYRASRDQGLRDRLILNYAPLVKYVAGRLWTGLPAHVDHRDLVAYGLLGLIGAIERFDPGREITFERYAIARIKGSIIDELRSMDWVPRSVRARAREIERAMVALESTLRRPPTDEEVAAEIGITEPELQEALTAISQSSVAALDELWATSSGGGDTASLIDTVGLSTSDDPSQALAVAIDRLPEREQVVISLYDYEGLTLREIGEVLGVTESRVSQLHTKAVLLLRTLLGRRRDDDGPLPALVRNRPPRPSPRSPGVARRLPDDDGPWWWLAGAPG